MGNKNNYSNANFVQVGYQHNGCNNGCDNNNDVMAAASYSTGCGCDNDAACTGGKGGYDNGAVYGGNSCGCDNDDAYTGKGRERDCDCDKDCGNGNAYASRGKWNKQHGDKCCNCDSGNADETHVFFETCDGAKEICVTGRCQEDEALGRTLDVNCTLLNVCPGRRSALGITLTEMDEDGTEYARGFRAITVPAHNARCNQDLNVDTVRFILPEDLSLQNRRHFIVRTQHHYLDASSIWNNGWGGGR